MNSEQLPEQGLLSIIIVNYYSSELVSNCLQSIFTHVDTSFIEFIVVSNGEYASHKETFKNLFPMVQWLDMDYNAGFARANNQGMREASGEVFLLLNPDTLAIDDSINRCYKRLQQSSYGAAGVQIFDQNRIPQISGSHFVKGGLNHLLPIPYWGDFIRWIGYRTKTKVPGVSHAKTIEDVEWISGAFLMVKKKIVEEAGLMDEDFFLYGEEVEWCSRLSRVAKLCLFGDSYIVHLEGSTINKSQNLEEKGYYNLYDRKGLQLMVSNHLRVKKQYGFFWFFFLLLNYTWGVLIYFICHTAYYLVRLKNPIYGWTKIVAFGINVGKLWQLIPKFISKERYFFKIL